MTIISNNCWGTFVYQRLGVEYASPFVNLFIAPDCYLRLLRDLPGYLAQPLGFVPHSKHAFINALRTEHKNSYPIATLGDIELQMLHYDSPEQAAEEWARRVQRVDYSRLMVKFDDTNNATAEQVLEFHAMPYARKVCFVGVPLPEQPLDAGLIWHAGL